MLFILSRVNDKTTNANILGISERGSMSFVEAHRQPPLRQSTEV